VFFCKQQLLVQQSLLIVVLFQNLFNQIVRLFDDFLNSYLFYEADFGFNLVILYILHINNDFHFKVQVLEIQTGPVPFDQGF